MTYAEQIAATLRRDDFVQEVHVITTLGPTDLPGVRRPAQLGSFPAPEQFSWPSHIRDWADRYPSGSDEAFCRQNEPCTVQPIYIHKPANSYTTDPGARP